ncbi:MAG: aspartate aminotransferase family protein [Deltaproteobacteria bacterium]|nr:aspartate aminotransferase family protein [Deltaproteobacteria bacterium]
MSSEKAQKAKQEILVEYQARTKASFEFRKKAIKYLPGGDTRSVAYYPPYPFYAAQGKGCFLYDLDGNEYIDCVNNMTSLVHGHAHPQVVAAICEQAARGSAHAAPTELQSLHAEKICGRIPSMESLRFCNSGTEATMFAIRAARAFTKKNIIVKIDGGYHGSHDYVEVNLLPDLTADDLPKASVEPGVPPAILNDVRIAPYNDLNAMRRIMEAEKGKVAAIVVEPVLTQGGGIVPDKGYLAGLRELADAHAALLIFDEVITFRFSTGGRQLVENVRPDLTALGKIIGGGLPVGAFGGRADIMQMFDPTQPNAVTHSGTFSGNALTMAAGMTTLDLLGREEIDRINGLGERLSGNLKKAMDEVGITGQVCGVGSAAFSLFFDTPFRNAREAVTAVIPTLELAQDFHLALLNQGVYAIAKGMVGFIISTPMDVSIVDLISERYRKALEQIKPIAEAVLQ